MEPKTFMYQLVFNKSVIFGHLMQISLTTHIVVIFTSGYFLLID